MQSLIYTFRNNPPFAAVDESADNRFAFGDILPLTGGHVSGGRVPDCDPNVRIFPFDRRKEFPGGHDILKRKNYEVAYDPAEKAFYFFAKQPHTEPCRNFIWETALRAGWYSKILRGENVLLMHGALLETKPGEGVFLCGQSGMGKSTTAGRWKQTGGICSADDMVMMEYEEDGSLYAHPLPTWSRNREQLSGELFPFEPGLKVNAVVALSRSENGIEELKDGGNTIYMLSVYSSGVLFMQMYLERLPETERNYIISRIRGVTDLIFNHYPHNTLYACLNADIKETLKGYCI